MALDKNYMMLDSALKIANAYYDKKTLAHAKRVLYFDTDYDPKNLPPNFKKTLELITKPDDLTYDEYCLRIHNRAKQDYGLCAWFVKLADIKDHLSQVDTLTPRLKEKYLSGLRYLL